VDKLPAEWILANHESVSFSADLGAHFSLAERNDAPTIWTDACLFYGSVEVVLQSAPGIGVITLAVLMSQTLDEIDWEWSGNDFAKNKSTVQTNYYGKGITGNWDRGTQPTVDFNMTQTFHTYKLDWTPDSLTWSIDGAVVRTLHAKDCDAGDHQYPQTPSRFHLGVWDGGDPDKPWYTAQWAGGYTDLTKLPYTGYVRSVTIKPLQKCYRWSFTDRSGSGASVKCEVRDRPAHELNTFPTTSTEPAHSFVAPTGSASVSGSSEQRRSVAGKQAVDNKKANCDLTKTTYSRSTSTRTTSMPPPPTTTTTTHSSTIVSTITRPSTSSSPTPPLPPPGMSSTSTTSTRSSTSTAPPPAQSTTSTIPPLPSTSTTSTSTSTSVIPPPESSYSTIPPPPPNTPNKPDVPNTPTSPGTNTVYSTSTIPCSECSTTSPPGTPATETIISSTTATCSTNKPPPPPPNEKLQSTSSSSTSGRPPGESSPSTTTTKTTGNQPSKETKPPGPPSKPPKDIPPNEPGTNHPPSSPPATYPPRPPPATYPPGSAPPPPKQSRSTGVPGNGTSPAGNASVPTISFKGTTVPTTYARAGARRVAGGVLTGWGVLGGMVGFVAGLV
jgi:beta-glucanase (GH16 family)